MNDPIESRDPANGESGTGLESFFCKIAGS
jgi:hypothetical protein